jgi:hypothetical protein
MTRVTNALAAWSIRTYRHVVRVYPCAFRHEFGESMTQVFREMVRRECSERGLVGLIALWLRTAVDVLVSVISAYSRERSRTMVKLVLTLGAFYVCSLALTTGYGAIRFGEFYEPPPFSRFGAPATTNENSLLAAYDQALGGEFGRYKQFTRRAGLVLAVWLGIVAALFGRWHRSVLHGAGALMAGAVLTVAAFELLPTIWFPLDKYAAGFVWLLSGLPVAAGTWMLLTVLDRVGRFGSWRIGAQAT